MFTKGYKDAPKEWQINLRENDDLNTALKKLKKNLPILDLVKIIIFLIDLGNSFINIK